MTLIGVTRRRSGLVVAATGYAVLAYAGERINSAYSDCFGGLPGCEAQFSQFRWGLVVCLLLIAGSLPLLAPDLRFGMTMGGTFFGLGVGSLIAAANGAGLGAWLMGGICVVVGPFVGLILAEVAGVTRTARAALTAMDTVPAADDQPHLSALGQAVILALADTGGTVNDNPMVRLSVRISPADGSPTFTSDFGSLVSRLAIPRPGDQCPVRYDPDDPSRVQPIGLFTAGAATAQTRSVSAVAVDVVSALTMLDQLRLSKGLTEPEYEQLKARLLAQ
jgi:hypothetical protein